MNWNITKALPLLTVPELEAGIDFYQRLGFAVEWRWPEKDPTHAELKHGSCLVMLSCTDSETRARLAFVVDDVDACYEAILTSRAWEENPKKYSAASPHSALDVPAAPHSTDYGMREFALSDPWGNEMTFASPNAPEQAGPSAAPGENS